MGAAPGTDTQAELAAGWQRLGLEQNTAELLVRVTCLTGTQLWPRGLFREQFTLSVQATPSTIQPQSRCSTVATSMFTTYPIRPTVTRASVLSTRNLFVSLNLVLIKFKIDKFKRPQKKKKKKKKKAPKKKKKKKKKK